MRAAVRRLSQERFNDVVVPYLSAARSLAQALTVNRADAEDIVQEASLRAYRALDRFRGGSPRAWVLTIVRHTAYDCLLRRRRAPEPIADFEDQAFFEGLRDDRTPESLLLDDQQAVMIRRAIHELPQVFLQTLLLRYDDGLTHRQIAARTGVPAGTVMSRLNRARRRLAAELTH